MNSALKALAAKGIPAPLVALFLVVTLSYGILVPPFSQRDEPAHFANAVRVALGAEVVRDGESRGVMIPRPLAALLAQWPFAMEMSEFVVFAPGQVVAGLTQPYPASDGMAFASTAAIGSYPPTLYLPQAAGLRLAHAAGLPALAQFYAGRLAGGMATTAVVLLAACLMPFGGRLLFVVALLPGAGSQFATYSADATIISVAFLTTALVLRAGRSAGGPVLSAVLPLLVLSKGVYAPIGLAGLANPGPWRRSTMLWLFGGLLLGVLAVVLWFGLISPSDVNRQTYVHPRTLQRTMSAVPREQAAFILANPLSAIGAIAMTMVERLPAYCIDALGRFGWALVLLPWPLYALALAVLAAGVVPASRREMLPQWRQRAWWVLLVFAVVFLVHLAQFLLFAPLGDTRVSGVQGRYFLPALPILGLALQFHPPLRVAAAINSALPWACAALLFGSAATPALVFWQW